jgi:very-short-patch-repair endonuclease
LSRDLARQLRRNLTDAERKLWRSLRGRHFAGFKFRRQQPLGPYVADFVCLERRLVIEADGGEHAERAGRDAERTRWLAARGYRVMRFWNHQVLGETEAVLAAIHEALGEHPSPQPSPSRGEGVNRD